MDNTKTTIRTKPKTSFSSERPNQHNTQLSKTTNVIDTYIKFIKTII